METDDASNHASEDLLSSDSADGGGGRVDSLDDSRDDSHDDDDDGGGIAIGRSAEALDPDAGRWWSCLVDLRAASAATAPNRGFLYSTHGHPLLNFAVCSVCEERAEAVESDVIDAELSARGNNNLKEETTTNACSWCGLEDDELGDNDDDDDIPASDLLLCDACPRAFCVRCAVLSLGGDRSAWEAVREVLNSEGRWACCRCEPTPL